MVDETLATVDETLATVDETLATVDETLATEVIVVRTEDLEPIVAELVTKPRHEKVRAHLLRLLTDGLGADATSIDFERALPEVRGRVDALLGRTVFEIKSDLVRERSDAERQLSSYLPQREAETGQSFVGIATDGAEFRVYMTEKVAGIDVHPVAVNFARATYLLALMPTLQQGRPRSLSVPVYLGDALQWNAREFMSLHDLEIIVPAPGDAERAEGGTISVEDGGERVILHFPMSLARDPGLFSETLEEMLSLTERAQPVASLSAWLARRGIADGPDLRMLCETYEALGSLRAAGRNHIWGYVARNLSRPVWLATEQQKADVVVGNPPWLDYRAMKPDVQRRFREEMRATGLWAAKVHGAAFDLSADFFARAVHLYMRNRAASPSSCPMHR